MKKLAKLTAVFAVICLSLAFSACGHSGSDYDWKNPNGSSGSNPEVVLTLTAGTASDGEQFVFYSDGTFTYVEYYDDEKDWVKGTYTGDAS